MDHPINTGSLGTDGIVVETEKLSNLIEEFGLSWTFAEAGHNILLQKWH
jgi:hypothetical protein